ncbi:MAG: hypothetical protein WBO45_22420, partial [Planctomycetota bacterium]
GRLCARANGDLIVCGGFTAAGGVPAAGLARWNGSAWSAIGGPVAGGVSTVVADPLTGDLLVAGTFSSIGGVAANGIAAWNGTAWSPLTTGVGGEPRFLVRLANGALEVGGGFGSAGSFPAMAFATWNGTQWQAPGQLPVGTIGALASLGGGDLVAADSVSVRRRTAGAWTTLGVANDILRTVLALPNGDVIAAGDFTQIGGVAANHIARWNGTAWAPLGQGCDSAVLALTRLPNGDVVAGGAFAAAGGVPAARIARWNGSAWAPLGTGLSGATTFVDVRALTALPDGTLVAGGSFTIAGGTPANYVARWDGASWSPMGTGLAIPPLGFVVMPNGSLVAHGYGNVLRSWDGSAWTATPAAANLVIVYAAIALPDGDLLIAGADDFQYGPWRVLRFQWPMWTPVGLANDLVSALVHDDAGRVLAGGRFSTISGTAAMGLGTLASSCPALATSVAPGCPSSGGANLLAATSLPWLGGTLTTTGTGLPANAVVAVVRGFAPLGVPLPQLLPQGQPGCVLWLTPDLLSTALATNGTATATLAMPWTMALVGQAFGEQWVPLELGAGPAVVSATSTNLLVLTLGSF